MAPLWCFVVGCVVSLLAPPQEGIPSRLFMFTGFAIAAVVTMNLLCRNRATKVKLEVNDGKSLVEIYFESFVCVAVGGLLAGVAIGVT